MATPKIQVLGPMQVRSGPCIVPVSSERLRAFLGALTISVNHAVRIDTLVEVVWHDHPPAALDSSIHSLATRLRELIGHEALVLEDHSYCLFAQCHDIDACVFETLAMQSEDQVTDDPGRARATARAALGLWRGPAYGELGDADPFRLEAIRLDQIRCSVTETLIEAELALGHSTRAIPMLMTMLEETPYRERMWMQLIAALGREGRRGEALETYRRYTAIMRELGLEPGGDVSAALERALTA